MADQLERTESFKRPKSTQDWDALWRMFVERNARASDASQKITVSLLPGSKRRWQAEHKDAMLATLTAQNALRQFAHESVGKGQFTLVLRGFDPRRGRRGTVAFLKLLLEMDEDEANALCERAEHLRPEAVLTDVPQGLAVWSKTAMESTGARVTVKEGATRSKDAGRPTIPAAVRREVWNRDGGRCVDCGSRERLEYDHIVPLSKGGANTARNIELRCERCNRSKGAQP